MESTYASRESVVGFRVDLEKHKILEELLGRTRGKNR